MRVRSSKERIWRRQLTQLEQTWQADLGDLGPLPSANDGQHFLVRELYSILRRLGSLAEDSAGDGTESAVVEAAWAQYGKIRQHAEAAELLQAMSSALLGLLVCALNFARAPLVGSGSGSFEARYTRIVRVFADLRATGRTLDHPEVFAAYLRALNNLGNSARVLQEAVEYEQKRTEEVSGYELPSSIERQVIRACFGVRRSDLALARLQRLGDRATLHVHVAVISGLIADEASDRMVRKYAAGLLGELSQSQYTPAARTGAMNEVLHTAGRHARTALLLALYELLSTQASTNAATLGIILHCAVRQEPDARQLRRVFVALCHPEGSVYASLSAQVFGMFIDAFVRIGRADYACEALDALRDHPEACVGARHVAGLLAFYAEHAAGVHALRLFRQTVGDGVAMPWMACEHTALALARSEVCEADVQGAEDVAVVRLVGLMTEGNVAQASEVFNEMVHAYPASAPLAFACLLLADSTSDEHYVAMKHALHLAPPATSAAAWPAGLFDAMLGALAQQRDREGVEHVYALMVHLGYDPSARTFNMLLLAFARGSDVDPAGQVLEEMCSDDHRVRAPVVSALVHMLLRQASVDRALAAYAMVVGRTLPLQPGGLPAGMAGRVDFYALAMLVRALALAGRAEEAMEVFGDAFELLEFVPRRLLETLVATLEDKGMHEEAQACLRRFARKVEECQPPAEEDFEDGATAERLPLSHFAYALGAERDPGE